MHDYVNFFRTSAPYINTHRGATFVIALDGEAMRHSHFSSIVQDIALLQTLGIRIVLVHGARPQVEARLQEKGLTSDIDNHIRVTSTNDMHCVKEAVGRARFVLEAQFSMGLPNTAMHGAKVRIVGGNFITARPMGIRNGIDYHHSGEVRKVDTKSISKQLDAGNLVLLSPIGFSPTGEAFNVTYESVATQTAISLDAEKLIFLNEKGGLQDSDGNLRKSISLPELYAQLGEHNPDDWQQPILRSAYQACRNGVDRTHLISYQQDGALLTELFTREGSGTLVLEEANDTIRPATIDDIGGILDLIRPLELAGVLVQRSRELLENEIHRFFVVISPEGLTLGCAALYPYPSEKMGELACVATHADYLKRGVASRLLDAIEKEARIQGIDQLFVLTTQTAHWFLEKGFVEANIERLPVSKKALYNYQRNSKVFVKTLA